MKVYHFKHHDVLLNDLVVTTDAELNAYHQLMETMLLVRNISEANVYEACNLCNYTMKSNHWITARWLKRKELPAFCFLLAKN